MKKLSEILELPVMEILNGKVAGRVKDVILHPDTKEVCLVMDEGVFSDFHILQKEGTVGIGSDFITIKTSQAIKSTKESPEFAKILTEYYSIQGLLVITSGGDIVSKIVDFTINEQNWQIVDIILEDDNVFQKNQLLSISEKYVFVQTEETVEEVQEETAENEELDEEAYLIGMTVQADVTSEDGLFTISTGTMLTKKIIDEAKEQGILAELIMAAE